MQEAPPLEPKAPDDGVTQGNANRLLKNIAAQTGADHDRIPQPGFNILHHGPIIPCTG